MSFKPTEDQTNDLIFPAWEEIRQTADDLKEDLGCDNEYIRKMLISLSEYYVWLINWAPFEKV